MIAILSDFGHSEYLGIMKGVIHKNYHEARILDLFNNITAHNILEGSWILLQSYKHFPKDTVFLCVVDPGVGVKRVVADLMKHFPVEFIGSAACDHTYGHRAAGGGIRALARSGDGHFLNRIET